MKKLFPILLIAILFAGCKKNEPNPQPRTYNLAGRIYERYETYSFSPNRRSYHTLDFVDDTTVYRYNGTDTLGVDSVWHRKDTVMASSPYFKPYNYSIADYSNNPYAFDYVAEISFYRWESHTSHGQEYTYKKLHYTYQISDDELWIWNKDQITDEYQRIR